MRSFCLPCSLSIDFLFLFCFFWHVGLVCFCSVPFQPNQKQQWKENIYYGKKTAGGQQERQQQQQQQKLNGLRGGFLLSFISFS